MSISVNSVAGAQTYQTLPMQQMGGVQTTATMPSPATIEKQKAAYEKLLQDQLKQGMTVLDTQVNHQKDYLAAQARQQKMQFAMQIEMEVKQQEMALQQQHLEQSMSLQQQVSEQQAQLQHQAMMLTMEYQQKKTEEEMAQQAYDMEMKQIELQNKMQTEMSRLGVQVPPTPQLSTQRTMTSHMFPSSAYSATPTSAVVQEQAATYVYGENGELVPREEAAYEQECKEEAPEEEVEA